MPTENDGSGESSFTMSWWRSPSCRKTRCAAETTFVFDHTGRSGIYNGSFGPGEFSVPEITTTPYSNEIQFNSETGAMPTYRFTLHYDLTWSNNFPPLAVPRIANPSRLEGFELLQPDNPLRGGTWKYVPGQ